MAGEWSTGPAAAAAAWFVSVLNGGEVSDADARERFLPEAMPLYNVHTAEGRQSLRNAFDEERPLRLVTVSRTTPTSIEAELEDRSGRRLVLYVDVEPQAPYRISSAMALPRLEHDDAGQRSPSMTAALTACARASHLLWDGDAPVFADELAIRLVPEVMAARVRSGPPVATALAAGLMVVVRSRYAEDALFEAVDRGTAQYVLLGAGLDSFAYGRADRAPGLRVFEVDELGTQEWKRSRVAAAGVAEPSSVTFVPVDFATEQLGQRLQAAGLDCDAAAFFAWLGVVYYLSSEAIDDTLRFISTCGPGTEVVFDYMDVGLRAFMPAGANLTTSVGEPLLSMFTPAQMTEIVTRAGLQVLADLGPAEAATRFFSDRVHTVLPDGPIRVLHARVSL